MGEEGCQLREGAFSMAAQHSDILTFCSPFRIGYNELMTLTVPIPDRCPHNGTPWLKVPSFSDSIARR